VSYAGKRLKPEKNTFHSVDPIKLWGLIRQNKLKRPESDHVWGRGTGRSWGWGSWPSENM